MNENCNNCRYSTEELDTLTGIKDRYNLVCRRYPKQATDTLFINHYVRNFNYPIVEKEEYCGEWTSINRYSVVQSILKNSKSK